MRAATIKRNAAKKPLISGRRPDMTMPDIELMPHQDFGFQPPPRRPPRPFDQCVEHCGIAAVSNFAFSLDWV
jgi:hypothetical protein